jgi:hypothetical protein
MQGLNRWRIQFNPSVAAWLLDHFIRPHQHIRWNGQADLLGGIAIVLGQAARREVFGNAAVIVNYALTRS